MKYHGSLSIVAKILYAAVTTIADTQTLGEEYTGIIQVNSTLGQLPSKKVCELRTSGIALGYMPHVLISKLITLN